MASVKRNISIPSEETEVLAKLDSCIASKYIVKLIKDDIEGTKETKKLDEFFTYIDMKLSELVKSYLGNRLEMNTYNHIGTSSEELTKNLSVEDLF